MGLVKVGNLAALFERGQGIEFGVVLCVTVCVGGGAAAVATATSGDATSASTDC